jgi:hypothetical protein
MPDLRTELQKKVLPVFKAQSLDTFKFDDEGEVHTDTPPAPPPPPPVISKGVTQATFHLVKHNPNKYTMAEVTRTLGSRGYKKPSVASLVSQMLRAGAIAKDPSARLYAIDDVLRTLPASGKRKPKTAEPIKQQHTKVPAKPAPEKPALPINIDDLTLGQARAIYNELRALFGDR